MNEHTGRLGFPQSVLFVATNIEAGEAAQEDSTTAAGTLSQSHLFFVLISKMVTRESAYDASRTTIRRGVNLYG